MKKFLFLLIFVTVGSSLSAMVRAGVDLGPNGVVVDDGYYYNDWYGPGVYYGVYYDNYPAYYSWQNQYYYGGPRYWRYNHNNRWNHRGHKHGGGHRGKHGGHH